MFYVIPAMFGLILLFSALYAAKKGSFNTKFSEITREKNPFSFWGGILVIGLSGLLLIVEAIFLFVIKGPK
jgi:hypothetical protein